MRTFRSHFPVNLRYGRWIFPVKVLQFSSSPVLPFQLPPTKNSPAPSPCFQHAGHPWAPLVDPFFFRDSREGFFNSKCPSLHVITPQMTRGYPQLLPFRRFPPGLIESSLARLPSLPSLEASLIKHPPSTFSYHSPIRDVFPPPPPPQVKSSSRGRSWRAPRFKSLSFPRIFFPPTPFFFSIQPHAAAVQLKNCPPPEVFRPSWSFLR